MQEKNLINKKKKNTTNRKLWTCPLSIDWHTDTYRKTPGTMQVLIRGRNAERQLICPWPCTPFTLFSAVSTSFNLKHMVTGKKHDTKPLFGYTQGKKNLHNDNIQQWRGHKGYTQLKCGRDNNKRNCRFRTRERKGLTTFWIYPISLDSFCTGSMIAFISYSFLCVFYLLPSSLSLLSHFLYLHLSSIYSLLASQFPLRYLLLWQTLSSLLLVGLG